MTEFQILTAMTYINSAYIDSAQKKLGYLPEEKKPIAYHRKSRTLRRILTLAAALMIMLSVLLTTALAVSEDFREFVFSFFRVEEPEVIPDFTPETELSVEDMFVEPGTISIGGVIEGTYVHTPRASNARCGIYEICTDEVELRQGSHYDAYYEENGEFHKLEERTFCQNYTVLGNDIHVEFEWVEHNGMVSMTYVEPNVEDFRTYNEGGSADSVLLRFQCTRETENGEKIGTWYPVLLNLHTGELKDVLAGTGAENLNHIVNCAANKEQTYMLLVQDDGTLYCADLVEKKLYNVDEISGEHAEKCSLIGDTLACWRLENGGYYKGWNIDLKTLECRQLFQGMRDVMPLEEPLRGIEFIEGFDTSSHSGNMYAGTRFALLVDEGMVFVIDLETGLNEPIVGFTWPEGEYEHIQRQPSPDGQKLLLYGWEPGTDYRHIGVLDYERKTYVEFSRTHIGDDGDMSITWFDPETIIIHSATTDLCSDYYVYRLLDTQKQPAAVTEPSEPAQTKAAETAAPIPEPQKEELVKITDHIPTIRQSLAYATEHNFTGQKIYDFTDAYLRYGTVKKLAKVCEELARQGIGLKIWDGYRPLSAQETLWELCPDANYVSHPVTGNRTHCRGNTVDVTLVDLETGEELTLPTGYDDFTAHADRDYSDCSEEAAKNAGLLEETMKKHGFTAYFKEWWHFSDEESYPVEETFDPAIF